MPMEVPSGGSHAGSGLVQAEDVERCTPLRAVCSPGAIC